MTNTKVIKTKIINAKKFKAKMTKQKFPKFEEVCELTPQFYWQHKVHP